MKIGKTDNSLNFRHIRRNQETTYKNPEPKELCKYI